MTWIRINYGSADVFTLHLHIDSESQYFFVYLFHLFFLNRILNVFSPPNDGYDYFDYLATHFSLFYLVVLTWYGILG